MPARESRLRLYGAPSDRAPLAWSWVEGQLAAAGTYWVVSHAGGAPHPRPVWGVWSGQRLHLSIGSPTLRRALREVPAATVHLDSGVEVVLVEGVVAPAESTAAEVIEAYDRKYDWTYDVEAYGHLIQVAPLTLLAWRAAGPAGRDSFTGTGRWVFDPPD